MSIELPDIQGLVVRGYGDLKAARYVLVHIDNAAPARAWLDGLVEQVDAADSRPAQSAVCVAISATGFAALGLPHDTLTGFSREFNGGIADPNRARLLGDVGNSAPSQWEWGSPSGPSVDLLLLLYADTDATVDRLVEEHTRAMTKHGLRRLGVLNTSPLVDREHFGFRDGVSQPRIAELGGGDGSRHDVTAGEFLLGYPNGYGHLTRRPLVAPSADPARALADDAGGSGLRDFGRNGSYLVLRQLEQDVRAFWDFCDTATGGGDREARIRLASKMVGRWPLGAPLAIAPDHDDPALSEANEFGYFDEDREGLRCPLGAHVRRSHPRDSLDPDPGTARSTAVGNLHRLLRRGRQYGRFLEREELMSDSRPRSWDEERRGLHFICLGGNLSRQFEFVQHSWIGNPRFAGLVDGPDPLLAGAEATFSVPADPVRRRYTGLPSFVTVRGGSYFFLPGLRALRYLASGEFGA